MSGKRTWCISFCFSIALLLPAAAASCADAKNPELEKKYEGALQAYASGDHDRSKQLLADILKEDSGFTPALVMQAKILYYGRNMEAAEEAFRAALRADSDNIDAMIGLARVLAQKDEGRDEALQLTDDAVRRSSTSIEAWYVKGLVHERRGELDQAIGAYRTAANEGRRLALVHLQLGQLYWRAGLGPQSDYELKMAEALSLGDSRMREQIESARQARSAPDP